MQEVPWESLTKSGSSPVWSSGVPALVQKWMESRGFKDFKSFEKFLSFQLKDLCPPSRLKDLDRSVDRLIQAYKNKENICLYADFDMDGTPGLVLTLEGLKCCGFKNLSFFQPHRFKQGYGVHASIVKELIEERHVQLFVTIDVGITDVKAVEVARELNVDFIITDHHQPLKKLPPAHAIVNPNQKDCSSGLNHLCGTGVAFYLILGLRGKMREEGLLKKNFDPKILLDCFAIATLTDMVPLIRENRVLVQHGMWQLARTRRLGLKFLMEKVNLQKNWLSSSDISIGLTPKLNALSRMQSPVQPVDVFLATETTKAHEKVEAVLKAQEFRVQAQEKGELLLNQRLSSVTHPSYIFQWSKDFHKGVVGLLANKMMQKYRVPAIVGSWIEGRIFCSARSPEDCNLLDLFENSREHLARFGGHRQAVGLELLEEKAPDFERSLEKQLGYQVIKKDFLNYDVEASLEELDDKFKHWLKKLEPYGTGFLPPIFKLSNLFVDSVKILKKCHMKFILCDIHSQKMEALWFFVDEEKIEALKGLSSQRVHLLAQPSINQYRGNEKLQLLIKDLQVQDVVPFRG